MIPCLIPGFVPLQSNIVKIVLVAWGDDVRAGMGWLVFCHSLSDCFWTGNNRSYCETLYWTGRIGEEIVFNCEV